MSVLPESGHWGLVGHFCVEINKCDSTCRIDSLHFLNSMNAHARSIPRAMHVTDTKAEKLAHRLSGILARLHQGASLDKHELVREFGVDVRTIERDLGQR